MQTFTHGATGEGAGWRNRHRVHDDCRLENASARPARRGVLGLSSGLRHCLWAALVFSTCMWPWCVGAGPGRRANTHTHKEKRCCCKGCGGTCASLGGASRQFPAGPRHVCCSVAVAWDGMCAAAGSVGDSAHRLERTQSAEAERSAELTFRRPPATTSLLGPPALSWRKTPHRTRCRHPPANHVEAALPEDEPGAGDRPGPQLRS